MNFDNLDQSMSQKTEYQTQFIWKNAEKAAVNHVQELKADHLNAVEGAERVKVEFQWVSEYAKEFGPNVLPFKKKEHVATLTETASLAVAPSVDVGAQTTTKPGVSDTASLAIPQSTTVSAQTSPTKGQPVSPVKSQAVVFSSDTKNTLDAISQTDKQGKKPVSDGKKVDAISMAIAPSTSTSAQTSPIKDVAPAPVKPSQPPVSLTNTSSTITPETANESSQTPKESPTKSTTIPPRSHTPISASVLKPVMAQYGQGNINPTVPQNLMKTFNVRAPINQIYPNTMERNVRIKEFDLTELNPAPPSKPPPTLPDPDRVLKEYMKARDLVQKIQMQFKSEYQRQYINWNRPIKDIRHDLAEEFQFEETTGPKSFDVNAKTAGVPSGVHVGVSLQQPTTSSRLPPTVKQAWQDNGQDKIFQGPVKPALAPVEYTRVQSIYHQLNQVKKMNSKPTQTQTAAPSNVSKTIPISAPVQTNTMDLAAQVLARASSRASSRN